MVRTPRTPDEERRWTVFVPAPPHPTTWMRGPLASTLVRPIPSAPGATTWPSALRGLDGLRDPLPHILAHGVPDRVLDGDGVARLHELLEVDDVPLRQLDRELADVVRGELLVDEPVDRRADRVADRVELALLHERLQAVDLLRRDADRDAVGLWRHGCVASLSDEYGCFV